MRKVAKESDENYFTKKAIWQERKVLTKTVFLYTIIQEYNEKKILLLEENSHGR